MNLNYYGIMLGVFLLIISPLFAPQCAYSCAGCGFNEVQTQMIPATIGLFFIIISMGGLIREKWRGRKHDI